MLVDLQDTFMQVVIVVIATTKFISKIALPVVMLLEVILTIRVALLDMLMNLPQVILIRWMVIFIYIPVMLLVQ